MSFSLFHPINFFNIDAQETVAYATNFTYPLKNVSVVLNDAQKLNEPCKDTHLKKSRSNLGKQEPFAHSCWDCKFALKK